MVDHLMDEVNADVRAERLHALWMKYRTHVAVVAGLVIVATAGNSLWNSYQQKRGGQLMVQFRNAERLFEQKRFDESANSFATLVKGTDGELNNLAQIWQARALVAAGKKDKAVAALRSASNHGAALWGDIACLRLASLDIAEATCLTQKKATPLAWQRAQWAAANAWAEGDLAKATEVLNALLKNESLPEAVRSEVGRWLATIAAQQAAPQAQDARE